MKKIMALLVSGLIGLAAIFDVYWIIFPQKNAAATDALVPTKSTGKTTVKPLASTSSTTSGKYKDGTYTGKTISTMWGNVQTQVTISNGKISSVKALEYPNSSQHSQQVNSIAIPQYTQEAIAADSAKIQSISGATVTYGGYTESLQAALDQAV